MYLSGGNSSSVRAKEKTREVFSRQPLISQQTFTPWGQFIQDGARIMFETVLNVEESPAEIVLQKEDVDTDGMNYLAGKTVDFVNKSAMNGTILAHTDGSVPNLMVKIPAQDAYSLGQLFYFFEFACGVSGYILGVNPFNQPGVESYKEEHVRPAWKNRAMRGGKRGASQRDYKL